MSFNIQVYYIPRKCIVDISVLLLTVHPSSTTPSDIDKFYTAIVENKMAEVTKYLDQYPNIVNYNKTRKY